MQGKGKNGVKVERNGVKIEHKMGAGRRFRVLKKERNNNISRGGIRRLAKRGGVIRLSLGVYEEILDFVNYYMTQILKNSTVFA